MKRQTSSYKDGRILPCGRTGLSAIIDFDRRSLSKSIPLQSLARFLAEAFCSAMRAVNRLYTIEPVPKLIDCALTRTARTSGSMDQALAVFQAQACEPEVRQNRVF
jgi:hypothetical protein